MTEISVTDEMLGGIARKQWDLFRRIKEGTLDPMRVSDALQAIIEGRFSNVISDHTFRFDKRQDGWELLEHQPRRLGVSSTLSTLDLTPFLKKGEECISGEEMRRRAITLGANLGQEDVEFLLDHPDLLPKRPEDIYYIIFPGTLWRGPRGDLHVPYLYWRGGRWNLHWGWLGDDWRSSVRFLRSRN